MLVVSSYNLLLLDLVHVLKFIFSSHALGFDVLLRGLWGSQNLTACFSLNHIGGPIKRFYAKLKWLEEKMENWVEEEAR